LLDIVLPVVLYVKLGLSH